MLRLKSSIAFRPDLAYFEHTVRTRIAERAVRALNREDVDRTLAAR
jgi:hypothetical protein